MIRSEWFWSEEGIRDREAVREICRREAPVASHMLAENMAWVLYQQRVRVITEIERRLGVVLHEVSHGSIR